MKASLVLAYRLLSRPSRGRRFGDEAASQATRSEFRSPVRRMTLVTPKPCTASHSQRMHRVGACGVGWRGGFVGVFLRFFPFNPAVTGKAVQSGHSSAAVTHHKSPFRFRAGAKPVSGVSEAKAGRRQAPSAREEQSAKSIGFSPWLLPLGPLRAERAQCGVRTSVCGNSPRRRVCAHRRQTFIALNEA
jgi:hypothetical protein